MKFYSPVKRKNNEPLYAYIGACNMRLLVFKQLLRRNIHLNKLKKREHGLYIQPNIIWNISEDEFNILPIINLYISSLKCFYDSHNDMCYYDVPKYIKCSYSPVPLDTIIKTLEYGGLELEPLFWLRYTYHMFIEITNSQNNNQ